LGTPVNYVSPNKIARKLCNFKKIQVMDARKRASSFFILSLVVLGACGGGESTSISAPVPAPTPAPAPAPTPAPPPAGQIINAVPTDYLSKVRALQAGQTLVLAPGNYDDPNDVPGLPIFNLNGTSAAPITITGPEVGPKPVLLGRSTHNTIRFSNASYVVVRNLEVDGRDLGGDGVNAQGTSHHITVENLTIRGVGSDQQVVAISTNASPNWNWTIRGNTIIGAGTGMYLGNSDGTNPFVAGLIERNVIRDTIGYNLQIKHQVPWPSIPGIPSIKTTTIIRHNVFTKGSNSATGGLARPNLLVGDAPPSGPGSTNGYEIYGNFFYQNPTEALFQGEGNVAFYGNLLVNDFGAAVNIQRHNGSVRTIRVFGNTVVASAGGISVTGGDVAYTQKVLSNAVFAAAPINASVQSDNVTDGYAKAANYLNNPTATLGLLDLFPKPAVLRGAPVDTSELMSYSDWNLDFNSRVRDWTLRGAYSGEGVNPGWMPRIEIKP